MKVTRNSQTGRETLRVADTEGDLMELEVWPHAPRNLLSIAITDDEDDDELRFFSRRQIRELLPHLQAFAECGKLELTPAPTAAGEE